MEVSFGAQVTRLEASAKGFHGCLCGTKDKCDQPREEEQVQRTKLVVGPYVHGVNNVAGRYDVIVFLAPHKLGGIRPVRERREARKWQGTSKHLSCVKPVLCPAASHCRHAAQPTSAKEDAA